MPTFVREWVTMFNCHLTNLIEKFKLEENNSTHLHIEHLSMDEHVAQLPNPR